MADSQNEHRVIGMTLYFLASDFDSFTAELESNGRMGSPFLLESHSALSITTPIAPPNSLSLSHLIRAATLAVAVIPQCWSD